MPIMSVSEFEAILTRVRSKIDKELVLRPHTPALENAQRVLVRAQTVARDNQKLKAFREELAGAGDLIREQLSNDGDVFDMTWDLIDFIDYRVS